MNIIDTTLEEQFVLGALLLESDNSSVFSKISSIKKEYFYREEHKKIFEAIVTCIKNGVEVSIISVMDELQKMNALDFVGGYTYLMELPSRIPNLANFDFYLKQFINKARLRTGIMNVLKVAEESSTLGDFRSGLEQILEDVKPFSEEADMGILITETFEKIGKRFSGHIDLVYSGFSSIDNMVLFNKSELAIVAGRPSKGKTAFLVNLFIRFLQHGYKVLFNTVETSPQTILERAVAVTSGVHYGRIRKGILSESDFSKISDAFSNLFDLKDKFLVSYFTLEELESEVSNFKPDVVIVDYLQTVKTSTFQFRKRIEEVDYITRILKKIANDNSISVIASSQINREAEKTDKAMLSQLRESGSIEQIADVVLFLQDADRRNADVEDFDFVYKIINVVKNREGATGEIPFKFYQDTLKFEEG
ncbi:MAG: DnaB-like helicase C-terminal domain-containing protein [Conexivisphaerales archaeon]